MTPNFKLFIAVLALIVAGLLAGSADAQTQAPTRVTSYDWQCQNAAGERISDHQRFDTALIACLNNAEGTFVQGGRYRINRTAPAPVDCAVSAWSSWTGGAWSACSNGQQTRQETRSRTIVTQPANGGAACPALTETRTATQTCVVAGTANLSWQYTQGATPATGFTIHYGPSPEMTHNTVNVNISARTYTLTNLAPGTYYFAMRALSADGLQSELSNIQVKTVQ